MIRLFLALLAGHLLGDFALQTDAIYRLKKSSLAGVFLHSLLVTLPMLLFLGLQDIHTMLVTGAILLTSHFVIDAIKNLMERRLCTVKHWLLISLDQLLHIVVIWLIVMRIPLNSRGAAVPWVSLTVAGLILPTFVARVFLMEYLRPSETFRNVIWRGGVAAACLLMGLKLGAIWAVVVGTILVALPTTRMFHRDIGCILWAIIPPIFASVIYEILKRGCKF